jgi:regulator of sirC expression with transglutaminase-like and TPR domain
MSELTFREELKQEPINVPRAALRFAKEIAYPELDVDQYMGRLNQLSNWADKVISPRSEIQHQALALAEFLFQEFGFHGNTTDYGDPRNSYLNDVLDLLLGIPISLSTIYVAVAQRIGVPARGVALPGHFIVSVQHNYGDIFLDPFNSGRQLSIEDCEQLVRATTGSHEPFRLEWLQPASPKDILTRMLNNLRIIYLQREAWAYARSVIEHLEMIQPTNNDLLRDLGVIYHKGGSLRKAVDYYMEYLTRSPDAPDVDLVKRNLRIAAQHLARLN